MLVLLEAAETLPGYKKKKKKKHTYKKRSNKHKGIRSLKSAQRIEIPCSILKMNNKFRSVRPFVTFSCYFVIPLFFCYCIREVKGDSKEEKQFNKIFYVFVNLYLSLCHFGNFVIIYGCARFSSVAGCHSVSMKGEEEQSIPCS